MRATWLVLALLTLPLAAAADAVDEVGDVLAEHRVNHLYVGGSPFAECDHPAADILTVSTTSAAGLFATQLLVADRQAQPDCPVPVVATEDARIFVLELASASGSNDVLSMWARWTEMNGVAVSSTRMTFTGGAVGRCNGGGVVAVGDAVTYSCPLQGTATLTNGATRAYDLRNTPWDVRGLTGHSYGTPATYVQFMDAIGPARLSS